MEILHSKILGEGTPLCILHGFLGMLDNWKTLGRRYAKDGYQVHLIDQRNHGKSFHSSDFNYGHLSQDLGNYLAHHKLNEAIIIGHSMGGKTAMQFAADYPKKVKKLIIADIAPKAYPPKHQYIIDALAALDFTQINTRKEATEHLAQYIPEQGIQQFLLKNLYWKEPGKLALRCNIEVFKDCLPEIGAAISSKGIYDGPSLFIKGERSDYVQETDLAAIRVQFSSAQIATIANAGHWLHAENPEAFYHKTLRFLLS